MSKRCPYCGEQIADTAKKCRFCGEWLEPNNVAVLVPEVAEVTELPAQQVRNDLQHLNTNVNGGNLPMQESYANPERSTLKAGSNPPEHMHQQMSAGTPQNPQIIVPQIIINNDISQNTDVNVEQNVDVEQNVSVKGSSSSSGWLYFELLCVGGATWAMTGKWWVGLITWIALIIGLQIPVLGAAICIVLGLGVGLLAGIISAALSAPTWACWVIGIIAALVTSAINFEDKDAED